LCEIDRRHSQADKRDERRHAGLCLAARKCGSCVGSLILAQDIRDGCRSGVGRLLPHFPKLPHAHAERPKTRHLIRAEPGLCQNNFGYERCRPRSILPNRRRWSTKERAWSFKSLSRRCRSGAFFWRDNTPVGQAISQSPATSQMYTIDDIVNMTQPLRKRPLETAIRAHTALSPVGEDARRPVLQSCYVKTVDVTGLAFETDT
jgi:hypothetical protein